MNNDRTTLSEVVRIALVPLLRISIPCACGRAPHESIGCRARCGNQCSERRVNSGTPHPRQARGPNRSGTRGNHAGRTQRPHSRRARGTGCVPTVSQVLVEIGSAARRCNSHHRVGVCDSKNASKHISSCTAWSIAAPSAGAQTTASNCTTSSGLTLMSDTGPENTKVVTPRFTVSSSGCLHYTESSNCALRSNAALHLSDGSVIRTRAIAFWVQLVDLPSNRRNVLRRSQR